ncbi:mandelate racemase/muconate lactonizing enzyme family protein [Pectobacterium versatile]|uniref:Galactokinase n=2 Tax=Pectobacterium versatile TaxID=2488639 RepID=A0A855MPD3_9GAMM|nr:mandelate racemase/muconate lactonizing enzyme family protein [Pectobacterium versatile]MBD0847692.1 galactokinase [Pectobacterium carotovorum subsp. carotovorum]ASN84919.1 Galactonate dehydratase [Pectobacterium versatile]MBA0160581.1 mandelate racemase/muconate lactonizing enzyme family protein [Pectobacterium versatile]MBQ4761376.1 galactokinase [Pectobacterium versatile]POY50591.1 galactokinase [Pectobacterium versatile]
MKITDVRVILANRYMFVEVTTDEGLTGIGESGAWGFLDASKGAVEALRTYLIGQDPLRIEHHWQYMYRCWHFRGAAIMGAISAIDIALWDIAGKYYDTPVYNLLGGRCRDKARVYAHAGGRTTEETIANLKKAKADGFTAIGHLTPFLDESRDTPYFTTHAKEIGEAIERIGLYREAVGNDVDLCIEVHRRLKPADAVVFARGIEPFYPYFIEDPIGADNFDSMAEVADKINIPIATGERLNNPQEFAMLIRRNAVAYVRPDVCMCGGITGAKKVAALAEANDLMVVPHNPLSPVSTAACLQIAVSIPNFSLLEYPGDDQPALSEKFGATGVENGVRKKDMVKNTFKCVDGFMEIPTQSGIGIELADDLESRFPYRRRGLKTRLHVDGSVVDQ